MAADARQRVLDAVRANPGASLQELADLVGTGRTSVVHHVRRLVKAGEVTRVRHGRRVLHLPVGAARPVDATLLAVMRQRTARQVVEAIQQDPSVSWRALARQLDVTPRAIRWHVKRLTQDGILSVAARPDRRVVLNRELPPMAARPDQDPHAVVVAGPEFA